MVLVRCWNGGCVPVMVNAKQLNVMIRIAAFSADTSDTSSGDARIRSGSASGQSGAITIASSAAAAAAGGVSVLAGSSGARSNGADVSLAAGQAESSVGGDVHIGFDRLTPHGLPQEEDAEGSEQPERSMLKSVLPFCLLLSRLLLLRPQ